MKLKHQENHLEVLKTDENQRHCFSIKNNGTEDNGMIYLKC